MAPYARQQPAHNSWRRETGNWSVLGDADDPQVRYSFRLRDDAPKGLKVHYVIGEDEDFWTGDDMPVLEVAEGIQRVLEKAWVHTAKAKITDLVAYLQSVGEADYVDSLRYDVYLAEYEVGEWSNRLRERQDRLCRYLGGRGQ